MAPSTPRDLATRLADLLRRERFAMADFLVELAEFDRGRHWLALGYANLFVEPLRDGRLCVTAIHALSKAITPENRAEVLPRFFHLSKQEAKAVSAELAPEAVVPRKDVVTVVPVPRSRGVAPCRSQSRPRLKTPNRLGSAASRPRAPSTSRLRLPGPSPSPSPRPRRASTSRSRPPFSRSSRRRSSRSRTRSRARAPRTSSPPGSTSSSRTTRGRRGSSRSRGSRSCRAGPLARLHATSPRTSAARSGPATPVAASGRWSRAARREYGDERMDRYTRPPTGLHECRAG